MRDKARTAPPDSKKKPKLSLGQQQSYSSPAAPLAEEKSERAKEDHHPWSPNLFNSYFITVNCKKESDPYVRYFHNMNISFLHLAPASQGAQACAPAAGEARDGMSQS